MSPSKLKRNFWNDFLYCKHIRWGNCTNYNDFFCSIINENDIMTHKMWKKREREIWKLLEIMFISHGFLLSEIFHQMSSVSQIPKNVHCSKNVCLTWCSVIAFSNHFGALKRWHKFLWKICFHCLWRFLALNLSGYWQRNLCDSVGKCML